MSWNKYDRELHENDWALQKIEEVEPKLRWSWIILGVVCGLMLVTGFEWASLTWAPIFSLWIYPFAIWCANKWWHRKLKKEQWEVKKKWEEEQNRIDEEIKRIDELNRKAQAEEIRKANERYYRALTTRNRRLKDSLE